MTAHPPINARRDARGQATWIALSLLAACNCGGGDDGESPDAALPVEFETQVTDLIDNAPLFDATVAEIGADNETRSAPNGRAVLQLTGDVAVSHELAGYLGNRMQVDGAALAAHAAARQPLLSELVRDTDLDAIYSGLGITRDSAATQVLIYLRSGDGFGSAAGVSVDAGGLSSAVRRAGAPPNFEAGSAVVDDPLIVVANAPGATLSIAVSGTCTGATEITLVPGQLASTFLVCD